MGDLQNKMIDAFAEEDYDKTAKLHSHVMKRVTTLPSFQHRVRVLHSILVIVSRLCAVYHLLFLLFFRFFVARDCLRIKLCSSYLIAPTIYICLMVPSIMSM